MGVNKATLYKYLQECELETYVPYRSPRTPKENVLGLCIRLLIFAYSLLYSVRILGL